MLLNLAKIALSAPASFCAGASLKGVVHTLILLTESRRIAGGNEVIYFGSSTSNTVLGMDTVIQ